MRKKREFKISELKFDKLGLVPAIIQNYPSKEVLMLAYMNKKSLRRTIRSGKTCFWSRSRKEYWVKGATSGNYQFVKKIFYDCDMDALLIQVRQKGVACHTGNRSCFYRKIDSVHRT
jgi:phosphoribosyl-ATP pyrophosphohydrolase/phosphoribosyl-AMP cyclohydrolase